MTEIVYVLLGGEVNKPNLVEIFFELELLFFFHFLSISLRSEKHSSVLTRNSQSSLSTKFHWLLTAPLPI